MPRSSRAHREHKHPDRLDSEEDSNSRNRKGRVEERGGGLRFSRVLESEKGSSQGKHQTGGAGKGDASMEQGTKRKDRAGGSVASDQWNGDAADDRPTKRRSEKDLSRDVSHRASSSQYKDAKENAREHGLERDKKVRESRHERSDDLGSRKQDIKTGCYEEERALKKNKKIAEWQIQDELRNVELEKELEKHIRRGDGSGERHKWHGNGRDHDDRPLSSRDDRPKNECYKDERHKDSTYRDKYREHLDRNQRYRDGRDREEHSSRDCTSDRSGSKHHRGENKTSESRYKKSRPQDSDHGGSYAEDSSTKYKGSRGRKRSFDENDAYGELKPQSAKESHGDCDRARAEYLHSDKIDSSWSNNQQKSSPSISLHAIKDQSRHSSRQEEPICQDLLYGERDRPTAASMGDLAGVSRGGDRTFDSRTLEKTKTKDHINSGEYLIETAASSQHGNTQRSDGQTLSIQLTEKPQSTSDHQFLYRSSTRCGLDIEDVAKKSSSYEDEKDNSTVDGRARELPSKKPSVHNYSQTESSRRFPLGPPPFSRNGHFPGSSPGHLPPVGYGVDSPFVLGSYEDDNRSQIRDHKSSSYYGRNGDINTGKGQRNASKTFPTWPSPVHNGFIPFQHGLMPPGFPPAVQQFPVSLFHMRPSMDVNYARVSFHMHEASSHVSPFGWHNPMEDPCPQMQGWDGSNVVPGVDSHVYRRPEWDRQNRYLMGDTGWGMSASACNGQNGNIEISQPQKKPEHSIHSLPDEGGTVQSVHQSPSEQVLSKNTEIKRSNGAPPAKNAAEAPPKTTYEKTPVPPKTAGDDRSRLCCNYLSKLDISVGLASPELYKQCLTLLGTSDPGVCNISKHGYHQNSKDENKVVGKSQNNILSSLFPPNTEAVFQRALSLYKKQHEAAKAISSKGQKDSSEAYDSDKMKVVVDQLEDVSPADADSCRRTGGGSNFVAEANDHVLGDAMEWQNTNADAQGDLSGHADEQHSDVISDAVVLGEGSRACEAIVPECRVNLSRMPVSPESTH